MIAQAKFGDKRQKIINDMIVGARTIKSYGWENYFIEKACNARKKQTLLLIKM
jgi:hypothetical protein